MSLPTTSAATLDPSTISNLTIIFLYPRTGAPNEVVPDSWNAIPGARGCTPQACSFRDNLSGLKEHGVHDVCGLSTQSTGYQKEASDRLSLPYPLVSDEKLEFCRAMKIPMFEWEGKEVCKRITLAVENGKIVKVWYPVFPPDRSAAEVLEWLTERKAETEK
ncbi:MAG: hypothetical protein MMC33_004319 [Icmadophila ericetorum]|nr:hypothetical protein [Icmadophila ericetorum]